MVLATQAIRCGDAGVVIAGGQESMGSAPHVLPNSRVGARIGEWGLVDSMINDGLWDVFNGYHMGCTAETIAERWRISRAEQDAFAAASQQRAEAAQGSGRFTPEVVPVEVRQAKGPPQQFDVDEFPRHGTRVESLARLKAAFSGGRDGHGWQCIRDQ